MVCAEERAAAGEKRNRKKRSLARNLRDEKCKDRDPSGNAPP